MMLNKDMMKLVGGILVGLVLLVALATCGGSSEGITQAPATPQAKAASQPTATASPAVMATPTPTATQSRMPPDTSAPAPTVSAGGDALLAKGRLLFEKTAGGVGCAYCHGLTGDGKGTAGVGAPPNRGKTEAQVRTALTSVTMMTFIKLTDDEIEAVVAYLKYLDTQP